MRISDWSSDVCSSDLFERAILLLEALPVRILALFDLLELVGEIFLLRVERSRHAIDRTVDADRSEERRVGKECVSTCRSRWSPCHSQKKQSIKNRTDTMYNSNARATSKHT